MGKLKQNSTDTVSGYLHQFWLTLDYCHNLTTGQCLYIEKYGDISISKTLQIEVKKYKDDLTNIHINLWKTLHNWSVFNFEHSFYKKLILRTTQQIKNKSLLQNWNDKTRDEKFSILKEIQIEYSNRNRKDCDLFNYMSECFADKGKLLNILDKFYIFTNDPIDEVSYNLIKSKVAGHIADEKQDKYLRSLFGFILSPTKEKTDNYVITYEEYNKERQELTKLFSRDEIEFPKLRTNVTESEIKEKENSLFVKKIDDIQYNEVKSEAIIDYIKAHSVINENFMKYQMAVENFEIFLDQLRRSYTPLRNIHLRDLKQVTDVIKNSQNFYDIIMSQPTHNFRNYNFVDIVFRNGCYHILADSEEEKIEWLLKTI